jgi:hypothetical protein
MTQIDPVKFFALWNGPMQNLEIRRELGLTAHQFVALGKRYGLKPRTHRMSASKRSGNDEAISEDEYEARKAEVQSRWSDAERERRRVGPTARRWRLPSYAYDGRSCSFVKSDMD